MASGASTEPPPLPPADYTPIPKEEWAKRRMPPLKGVIVDPEYPPTAEEAILAVKNHERNYDDQWQGQNRPQSTSSTQATQPAQNIDPYRKSGSSNIFGRVAGEGEKETAPVDTRPFKKPEEMGTMDVLSSIGIQDFKSVYQQPCFKETFMYSFISGFLVAGSLWILGKKRRWIVNGGMGTAAGVYFGVFPYCMWQRKLEKKNVMLVKETWEETKAEKKAAWEAYKAKKKADDAIKSLAGKHDIKTPTKNVSWNMFWSSGTRSTPGREG
jgi:hypothetical protein